MKRWAVPILLLVGSIAGAHAFGLGLGNRFGHLGTVKNGQAGNNAPPAWLNGADIGLNFSTNQYYVKGTGYVSQSSLFTLARSSPATATDQSGNVSTVASGAPAISNTGINAYESRANLVLQSGSIGMTPWATFKSGTGAITVTTNSGTAPDGTNSAALVAISRGGGAFSDFAELYQPFTGTAAAYSGSIWLKAATSADIGEHVQLALNNGTTVTPQDVELTGTWTRYTLTNVTLAASSGCQIIVGYTATHTWSNPTGAANFLAWGGDAELGATVTSYIPTTTAPVTRAADNITATGALATLLSGSSGSIAVWINSADQNGVAKTLVDANGTTLLGTTAGNNATSAVGATLTSTNIAAWTLVNNLGFSWNASGGLLDVINTTTTDSTARTPVGPFHLLSTGGTSNFWNGNVGTMLFYASKQPAPQVSLPTGVTPGFVSCWSNCPAGAAQFRDFTARVNANGGSPLFLQNSGAYNATGTNTPYIGGATIGSNYIAAAEGAVSAGATRQAQWVNINTYQAPTSNPLSWTPDASNPAVTATPGGLDNNFLLHPAITQAFASGTGGSPYTMYYSAIGNDGAWRIFWATSATGVAGSWTKQGVAINAGNAGYLNPGLPSVITVGSTVYLYAVTSGDGGNQIVVFTSPTSGNGSTWTYAGVALDAPATTDWDFGRGAIDPFVYRNSHGWYELGYTSYNGSSPTPQILAYAVSSSPLGPFVRAPTLLQLPIHNPTGDIAMISDANNFYFLWDEDSGVLNGTSNPYGATLPPY
jgi:hypothetical protein